MASALALARPLSIKVGGVFETVTPQSLLTPAELFACYQVSTSGMQTLRLSAEGNAVGGSLSLNQAVVQALTALVVPQGVKVLDNFAKTPDLNLAGDLVVGGKFIAFSTNAQLPGASISAANIFVQPGGLLTSYSTRNVSPSLDLSLNAAGQLLNAGTISVSGNLNANAISLTNQAGAQISAQNSIILNTQTLVNSGTVFALNGDLQIQNNNSKQTLNVSGTGNFLAPNGQILVSSISGMNLSKGNYSAKGITFTALNQNVTANVNALNGPLVVNAGTASVTSAGALDIAALNVTGDPFLASTSSVTTAGGNFGTNPFTVVSGGAITITSNLTAGDINLIAGVNYTDNGDGTTTINLPSGATGANVDTTALTLTASGNVNIGAFGNVSTGTITLTGDSSTTLQIYGQGNVTVGNINAGAQNVFVGSANPSTLNLTFANDPTTGGQITSGQFAQGPAQGGNVSQTAATTINSSGLFLLSSTGAIGPFSVTTAQLTATTTGNVTITNTGSVTLEAASTAGTFSLTTVADASGNGQITMDTGATVSANTISLTSTSADPGTGGIMQVDPLSVSTLMAQTINLVDTGTSTANNAEDISLGITSGIAGTPVAFKAQTTLGSASFQALGPVTMAGASFAGTGINVNSPQKSFALTTVPDASGAGAIVLAAGATITSGGFLSGQATSGNLGQLRLSTASTGTGAGGISQVDPSTTNTLFGDIILTNDSTSSASGAQDIIISAKSIYQTLNAFGPLGNVNLTNTGRVDLSNSSAGQNFTITATGGTESYVKNIETMNGSIYIEVNPISIYSALQSEPLYIGRAATISANNGNVTFINDNTVNGTIVIASQTTINVGSPQSGGTITFAVGPVPVNPLSGPAPAHVSVKTTNGGQVFLGGANIVAYGTGNTISANANQIIFSTRNSGGSGQYQPAIIIGQGNPQGSTKVQTSPNPLLFSLDLTDPATVALIQAGQASGTFGGKLTVGAGGQATGGTLILTPYMLGVQLTAASIPQGVQVTLNGFGGINNMNSLNVELSRSSTSPVVEVDGQLILNSGTFGPEITIASTQSNTWLNVSQTGSITSKSEFLINVVGNGTITGGTTITGTVSSPSVNLITYGNLTLNTSIGSPTGETNLSLYQLRNSSGADSGTIVQNAGSIIGSVVGLSSGNGGLGSQLQNLKTTAKSLQITSEGDVYIANTGALTLLPSGVEDGTFDIQNIGGIKVAPAVDPSKATLAAPIIILDSSGGSAGITNNGQIGDGTGQVQIAVQSSGSIVQGKGAIIEGTIVSLATVNGSIGGSATTAMLAVNTPELAAFAGTKGNVYISDLNTGTLMLDGSSAPGTFALNQAGAIDVRGAVAGTVATILNAASGIAVHAGLGAITGTTTLNVTGATQADITSGPSGILFGKTVLLTNASGGDIGTDSLHQLAISTPALSVQSPASASGNVFIDDQVAATVSKTAYAGGTFMLTAAGQLTVKGTINAPAIILGTDSGSNGGITLSANVGSSSATTSVTLATDGQGNVLQTGGKIQASQVNLTGTGGAFGTSGKQLKTVTSALTVNTNATAFVSNTGTVTVDNSNAKGGLQVTSSTGLVAGNVSSDNGFISLIATSGQLAVAVTDTIRAGNGNLTLNAAATKGTILIGANATVAAEGMSTSTGNVVIAIGKLPAKQTNTQAPANISPTKSNNGQIFYGANGITGSGTNITVSANARTVTFSTASAPASAITLNGGAGVSASQPIAYKQDAPSSNLVDTGEFVEAVQETGGEAASF